VVVDFATVTTDPLEEEDPKGFSIYKSCVWLHFSKQWSLK
jgi:hypothetical protein